MNRKSHPLWIGLTLALLMPFFWGASRDVFAAPPSLPLAGITPTPTFTPSPAPSTPEATPTPEVSTADPTITKRGEPSLALPGELVTFVIEATNTGQDAAVDVVVTDTVPDYLDILNVTSSQGSVTIEGQQITVEVGTIGSGYVVEIVVETRVADNAPVPLDLSNVAVLTSPNGGERTSPPATIVVPTSRMPETGRQTGQIAPGIALVGLLTILVALLIRKSPVRE
jgi:uncharacterized repeat protein (TIGR01451 family)